MKIRSGISLLLLIALFAACSKNTVSNVPTITLKYCFPDSIKVNVQNDTLVFAFTDGDGDIVKGPGVYIKDLRFNNDFVAYPFPKDLKDAPVDPKTGVSGECMFIFTPDILTPRSDSAHIDGRDTTSFQVYIVDEANHQSNTILTPNMIMHP